MTLTELFESCILYKHERAAWKKFIKAKKRAAYFADLSSPIYLVRFVIFLVLKMSVPGGGGGSGEPDQLRTRKRSRGSAFGDFPIDLAQGKLQTVFEKIIEEVRRSVYF